MHISPCSVCFFQPFIDSTQMQKNLLNSKINIGNQFARAPGDNEVKAPRTIGSQKGRSPSKPARRPTLKWPSRLRTYALPKKAKGISSTVTRTRAPVVQIWPAGIGNTCIGIISISFMLTLFFGSVYCALSILASIQLFSSSSF